MADAELLKKYNFIKLDGKPDEEEAELVSGIPNEKTGYPMPEYRHRIVVEAINAYIEEAYFWTIDEIRLGRNFNKFVKITDVHAASAQSAFFGVSEQRLSLQQEKAAGYLRGISEMLKALFQIVRELRIIDERMGYYKHTFERKSEEDAVGSEITLKGVWIDQVEGGVKNPASVFGLSQTVGFSVLPDLFFRARSDDIGADKVKPDGYDAFVKKVIDESDKAVAKMEGFNEKVKEVLKRKLTQYYMWKLRTFRELDSRRKFTIRYLRQHYDTIKLYMGWIKPYLRNIAKLQMAEKLIEGDKAYELITAFEGALMEVEVLTYRHNPGRKFHPCILLNIFYRTTPSLTYVQEGYQRGPAHTGKFDMTFRGYAWSDEQIKNYIRMKEEEDLKMLGMINEDIKASMDALGDELKQYLKEAGETFPEDEANKEPEKKPSNSPLEPFIGVFGGFKEIFTALGGIRPAGKQSVKKQITGGKSDVQLAGELDDVKVEVKSAIYGIYHNYKKLHGMLTW